MLGKNRGGVADGVDFLVGVVSDFPNGRSQSLDVQLGGIFQRILDDLLLVDRVFGQRGGDLQISVQLFLLHNGIDGLEKAERTGINAGLVGFLDLLQRLDVRLLAKLLADSRAMDQAAKGGTLHGEIDAAILRIKYGNAHSGQVLQRM